MNSLFPEPERSVWIGGSGNEPPEGSREWFLLTRDRLKSEMQTLRSTRQGVQFSFDKMANSGAWTLLNHPKLKRPFRSFDEFCRSSTGFGQTQVDVQARIQQLAGPEAEGGVREARNVEGGRPEKGVYDTPLAKGTSAARIVARLKRDAPEYADRLAAGEFRSARAAGIAAGIIVPPTKLEIAKRAVRGLSDEDQEAFRIWYQKE
jgi:hypothetical protein